MIRTTIHIFLHDLLLFLKQPSQELEAAKHQLSSGTRFWLVFLTELLVAFIITTPLVLLIDNYVVRLRLTDVALGSHNLFVLIILVVIFAPVLEELLFRYPLKFFKPRYLKAAVYTSSIIFGFIHATNYENNQTLFYLLLPLIISSQSAGGFMLAYLRMREGFLWSLFSHGLFNATVLLLSVLFLHDRLVISDKQAHYTLVVQEYVYQGSPQQTTIYRTGNHIDSIIWKQAYLQQLVDSLSKEPLQADQVMVDVDFKAAHPISADSILTLLGKEFRIE